MKKLLLILVFAFMAGWMMVSQASAFSLTTAYTGPIEIKFSDFGLGTLYWQFDPFTYGNSDQVEDSWGIFKVSTFKTPAAQTLWYDGFQGEEITGMYYGIDDDYWAPDLLGGGVNIQSVGGHIDMYLQDAGTFDPTGGPTARTGYNTYPTVTDGDLFLSLDIVPGIKYGDFDTSNDHITYDGDLDGTTSPWTGDSAFYLVITGGQYASMFDSNIYVLTDDSGNVYPVDFFAQNDLEAPGDFGWLYSSEDPVKGSIVPEPSTLLLLGIGLLGIGLSRRFKQH